MRLQKIRAACTWWLDRGFVLTASLVAAGAALYASFDALTALAVWGGWSEKPLPGPVPLTPAHGLPLTVDVIALAAGVRYARTRPEDDAAARQLAFKGVWWAGVVSVVGNAIVHGFLTEGWGVAHRVVAVLISAVPALGVGYVVHLLATPMRVVTPPAEEEPAPTSGPDDEQEEQEEEEEEEEAAPAPTAEVMALFPAQQRVARRGSIKARGLALMKEAQENGAPLPSTDDLKDALGCTLRHAQNIVRAWEKTA